MTTASPPTTASAASGIDWTACDPGFECARVPVPLDWSDPTGRQIELAVIRYLATKPDQRIGAMFFNPGGPGESGVGVVRDSGPDLSAFGDGRFDVVSWDPRGTHASSPVKCFATDADEAAFWHDVAIPSTDEQSIAYQAKMVDLAQRCGEIMGDVLSHISTADTARDLDRLRELMGEDQLTYVGLSYGTVLGQTYANMFGDHVRAMLLDGVVDGVEYTKSAEARSANNAASTDDVYDQFATLCDAAGPSRCALAGHPGQTAAQRVDQLFETLRAGTIPAPHADPPGDLVMSDLQLSAFSPLRDPALWPDWAADLDAAADGDASALLTTARLWQTQASWAEATKSSAISCLDGPAERPSIDWPTVIPELAAVSRWEGAIQGWWLWAPSASNWPVHDTDRYAGPWDVTTKEPILVIGTLHDPNTGYENAHRVGRPLRQRGAADPRRLRPRQLARPQLVHRGVVDQVPRRPRGATGRDRVRGRSQAVLRPRPAVTDRWPGLRGGRHGDGEEVGRLDQRLQHPNGPRSSLSTVSQKPTPWCAAWTRLSISTHSPTG